jgi:anhydro-N-acetylmuramic acid kinase
MSGTSIDSIDACLADFTEQPKLIAKHTSLFDPKIKQEILDLCNNQQISLAALAHLDAQLGILFGNAALELIKQCNVPYNAIKAIGCHGQTVYHGPRDSLRVTMQLGDPNRVAAITNITTVSDFRRKDTALNGEGAPLVPAFHAAMFQSNKSNRIIVNIGGMSNITILPTAAHQPITGFDTGPGNVLLDSWIKKNRQEEYDNYGEWGASGTIAKNLLDKMLQHPYLHAPAPKSTGREMFNQQWLDQLLLHYPSTPPQDVQCTLTHLTAKAIALGIQQSTLLDGEVILCGGGAYNRFLVSLIAEALPQFTIHTSLSFNITPTMIEPMAFAWLAQQTLEKQTGNLPYVTGASRKAILGGIYYP